MEPLHPVRTGRSQVSCSHCGGWSGINRDLERCPTQLTDGSPCPGIREINPHRRRGRKDPHPRSGDCVPLRGKVCGERSCGWCMLFEPGKEGSAARREDQVVRLPGCTVKSFTARPRKRPRTGPKTEEPQNGSGTLEQADAALKREQARCSELQDAVHAPDSALKREQARCSELQDTLRGTEAALRREQARCSELRAFADDWGARCTELAEQLERLGPSSRSPKELDAALATRARAVEQLRALSPDTEGSIFTQVLDIFLLVHCQRLAKEARAGLRQRAWRHQQTLLQQGGALLELWRTHQEGEASQEQWWQEVEGELDHELGSMQLEAASKQIKELLLKFHPDKLRCMPTLAHAMTKLLNQQKEKCRDTVVI